MKTKHVVVEIIPRVLWIIEGIALYYSNKFWGVKPALTDNFNYLFFGFALVIFGVYYLIPTFVKLAKPMFTKELVTDGPYKYIRHPMYVFMYLILFGVGFLFFSFIWFVVLFAFMPLWYFDCKLEESQMTDIYGKKYLNYKKQTGMFTSSLFKK